MKYETELESINIASINSTNKKINKSQIIYNKSLKYIIILISFFFVLVILTAIIIVNFNIHNLDTTGFPYIRNISNKNKEDINFFNVKDHSVINKPILPESENEFISKKYFKSYYNSSNIRYHFEDLFLHRKIFKINYSYHPYLNINKLITYDENANLIYEKTGMLNITKLNIAYYGYNYTNFLAYNHIHLSMGHDAKYILLSLVSIASILNTTNRDTFIHFHFVLLDSKFEDMRQIIELKKIYSNVEFVFYNGKQVEYDFSQYGSKEQRGLGDYTKFLIPEIVNNTNKIIILDSADIFAKKDLSEIYFFDLEDNYFGFALDISAGRYSKFFIFTRNKFYSNIGVCLVNVKQFRKDHLYKAGYFARLAYDHMPCPTQEMFFMISNYKFKYFPLIYNCPEFLNKEDGFKTKSHNTPLIKLYLKLQRNSPFRYNLNEILEADTNQIISHLFTAKILSNKANKKNGKIWIDLTKLANIYDRLKLKYPETFKFYET